MKVNAKLVLLSLLTALLWSCGEDYEEPVPDISAITAPVVLVRFDRDLMALDTNDMAAAMADLEARHPEFTDLYLRRILPLRRGDFSPEEQRMMLRAFVTADFIREVNQEVQVAFPDVKMEQQRAAFERALRYYKFYLPDAPRPDTLMAFTSQFELAAALYGDGDIAVGLEFFLGPDYDYAAVDPRETIFSDYLARSYTPQHLTSKLMQPIIEDRIPKARGGRLIDAIIYEGKKLYLLHRVLPETPDHVLHEITEEQMEWLRANEVPIYAHLQRENHLYRTDPTLIKKYTQPAPSTQGMPPEAPGRAVNYLGLQIVRAYVRANPRLTMAELMAQTDGQAILAGARYKPR